MATDQEKFDKIKKLVEWVENNIDDFEERHDQAKTSYGCDVLELIQAILGDTQVVWDRSYSLRRILEEDPLPGDDFILALIKMT